MNLANALIAGIYSAFSVWVNVCVAFFEKFKIMISAFGKSSTNYFSCSFFHHYLGFVGVAFLFEASLGEDFVN